MAHRDEVDSRSCVKRLRRVGSSMGTSKDSFHILRRQIIAAAASPIASGSDGRWRRAGEGGGVSDTLAASRPASKKTSTPPRTFQTSLTKLMWLRVRSWEEKRRLPGQRAQRRPIAKMHRQRLLRQAPRPRLRHTPPPDRAALNTKPLLMQQQEKTHQETRAEATFHFGGMKKHHGR